MHVRCWLLLESRSGAKARPRLSRCERQGAACRLRAAASESHVRCLCLARPAHDRFGHVQLYVGLGVSAQRRHGARHESAERFAYGTRGRPAESGERVCRAAPHRTDGVGDGEGGTQHVCDVVFCFLAFRVCVKLVNSIKLLGL